MEQRQNNKVFLSGLPLEHSKLGLEAGRRRHLPGRAEARVHRAVLPRARLQHHDGEPIRHALLQNGDSIEPETRREGREVKHSDLDNDNS